MGALKERVWDLEQIIGKEGPDVMVNLINVKPKKVYPGGKV